MLRCTHRCTCREWTTFSAVTSVNGYVLLRVGFNFDTFSLLARGNVRVKCGRSMRRLPAPPAHSLVAKHQYHIDGYLDVCSIMFCDCNMGRIQRDMFFIYLIHMVRVLYYG